MCVMRSKFQCFTRFARWLDVSHFAAFFIDSGPKRSIARSCKEFFAEIFFDYIYLRKIITIITFNVKKDSSLQKQ